MSPGNGEGRPARHGTPLESAATTLTNSGTIVPPCECSATAECGACGLLRIVLAEHEADVATVLAEVDATLRAAQWEAFAATVKPVPVEDKRSAMAPTLMALGATDLVYGLPVKVLRNVEREVAKAHAEGRSVAEVLDTVRDSPDYVSDDEWNARDDDDPDIQEAWALGAVRGDALLDPDFLRGCEDDSARYTRRVTAHHAEHGFRRGRPLAPCYSPSDLRVDTRGAELDKVPRARLSMLLANLTDRHGDHWYYSAPFCAECYGRPVAEARLRRWLLVNGPNRTPVEEIPAEVPGDLEPDEEDVKGASAFLSLGDLLALEPAEMLVEEILPAGAYGLITGRDGTGKSFLALDLALHLATGCGWYGERVVEPVGYQRALYLVGEGVQSFGKRVLGWLAEHDMTPAYFDHFPDALTLRQGTVDLYAGGPAYDDLLALVEQTEPDLLVIDTLARSSGAADANSATDMSQVLRRVDALKAACNGGTVLVVAHTTKSDADARGSSVVEDDADFVLHVDKKDSTQSITVAKMKDGPSGQKITLTLAERDDTLVLREARADSGPLLSEDASTRQRIEGALFATRALDPMTQAGLVAHLADNGKTVSRQMVGKALNDLVSEGAVVKDGSGRTSRYSLAPHRIPAWAQS